MQTCLFTIAGCLKEQGKGTNHTLPREFDNYPKSPLWGKLFFLHHYVLGVPTSGIFKNRVAAIGTTSPMDTSKKEIMHKNHHRPTIDHKFSS
jgi:hypothetical protein